MIPLEDSGSSGGTLHVAASGKPYPAAIVGQNGGKEGTVSFDQWNRAVSISAPKGATSVPSG